MFGFLLDKRARRLGTMGTVRLLCFVAAVSQAAALCEYLLSFYRPIYIYVVFNETFSHLLLKWLCWWCDKLVCKFLDKHLSPSNSDRIPIEKTMMVPVLVTTTIKVVLNNAKNLQKVASISILDKYSTFIFGSNDLDQ